MELKTTKSGGRGTVNPNADLSDNAGNGLGQLAAISAARAGRTARRPKTKNTLTWVVLFGCGALAAGIVFLAAIYFNPSLLGGSSRRAVATSGYSQPKAIARDGQTGDTPPGNMAGNNVASSNKNSTPAGVATGQALPNTHGDDRSTSTGLNWRDGPLPGQLFLHDGNGNSGVNSNSGHHRYFGARLPVPTISRRNRQQDWADQICAADSRREIIEKAFHESNPTRQYLLFQGALHQAISGGDCVAAIVINRDILRRFQAPGMDPELDADVALVRALAQTTRAGGQCKTLAVFALRVAGEMREARNPADSIRCDRIALHAALLTDSQRLRKQAEQAIHADSQNAERQQSMPMKIFVAPIVAPTR